MKQRLAHIAIVVNDYDEAIKFYTEKLHFELVEDTQLSETKRWVLVRPKGSRWLLPVTCKSCQRRTTKQGW